MIFRAMALIGAMSLSGCGYMVTSTLLDVGALDPFTSDPAGFAVGLESDSGMSLVEGSVKWTFEATHSPSGETQKLVSTLVEDRSEDGLIILTLTDADVARLRQWQQDLIPWKETSDGNSSLGFNITAESCRLPGAQIPEDPRLSIYLQLAADTPLRPFVRNAPILETLEADAEDIADLPEC